MPQVIRAHAPRKSLFTWLFEGIQYADLNRIPVSVDDYGIHCTSGSPPTWERDPRAGSVDPVGATVLLWQPPTTDIHRAALIALDSSAAMVAGLETGLRHEVPAREMMTAPNRDLFMHGLQVGIQYRSQLTGRLCLLHGRFTSQGPLCPTCVELECPVLESVS